MTAQNLDKFKKELSLYVPESEAAMINHVISSGKGSFYQDIDGKTYLDFSSGIFTNSFGHGEIEITETLAKVFGSLGNIHGRQYIGALNFYRRLFRFLPSKNYRAVIFGDGGGYTVDRCLMELFYHFDKKKYKLATFAGGFHGKTIGAKLAVNPNESCSFFSSHVVPPPYCYRCPFVKKSKTCSLECANIVEENLLACRAQVFLFEPVLGSSVIVPPENYWKRIEKFCRTNKILMVADEVLVGGGRIGTFLASTHYKICPDVIILTKGLANGLPLSLMLLDKKFTENIYSRRILNYSSTFVSLPALMAVADKVLEKIERENILDNVKMRGVQLKQGLENLQKKFPIIGDVRAIGLMAAIEFVKDDISRKIFLAAEQNGLELILPTSNIVRLAPPLNISAEEIELGLKLLERSLQDVCK